MQQMYGNQYVSSTTDFAFVTFVSTGTNGTFLSTRDAFSLNVRDFV